MYSRVLMIDDDPTLLSYLGKRFEKLGFKVFGARNQVEVRQQVGKMHFDFAIADVRMGDEDGVAIAADLQQKDHLDLPVAMLTGFDPGDARKEAEEREFQPFDWYHKIELPEPEEEFKVLGNEMRDKALADRFRLLAVRWRMETRYLSSITESVIHPSYQAIVGMGQAAIPFIIASLRDKPDWWFWALKAITGDDPVPAVARGNLQAMTDAWLEWAGLHYIRG
jgi:CheY-like chemotaxis protein